MNFLEMKNTVFLSQKVDGNMIFIDYWKVLVLIFSTMGNRVFFQPKVDGKMMFGLFELSIFQDLGNMVFRVVLYKLKTQETQTFVFFFPRHTGRFCRTFKIYCYRRRVSKIYKVWERSPQNWSKTFLLVP